MNRNKDRAGRHSLLHPPDRLARRPVLRFIGSSQIAQTDRPGWYLGQRYMAENPKPCCMAICRPECSWIGLGPVWNRLTVILHGDMSQAASNVRLLISPWSISTGTFISVCGDAVVRRRGQCRISIVPSKCSTTAVQLSTQSPVFM